MDDKRSGKIRKKRTYYAQVSNVALRDETMSLKAKGLLALIESYLSLDNFILYKDFLISKSLDGETSFRGAWKELKEHGYLIQYRLKDNETKQFYYEYEICDNPQVENQPMDTKTAQVYIPQVENPQVENPHVASPHIDKPLVEEPHDSLTTSLEPPLYNKPIYNNNILNNNIYINIIRTNIDYEPVFVDSLDKNLVDNIVDIMDEVLSSNIEYMKINGIDVPSAKLKSIFLKVNMNHIHYILNAIKNYNKKITNLKGFIITTIYNSVLTLDSYYSNLINVDTQE